MAKLSKDNSVGTLHPRENQIAGGTLAANSAEISTVSDGNTYCAFTIAGTFNATVDLQGSIDGVNWMSVPFRSTGDSGSFQYGATASGNYWANIAGFRIVKLKVTAFTSGSMSAALTCTVAFTDVADTADLMATVTAAASAAATLTLPAVPGLTHHITYLEIVRFAAAVQAAAATPNLVTTTNLSGSPVFTLPHEAAALGSIYEKVLTFGRPLRAAAPNTATTIVMPAVTGILWRANCSYYLAP